MMEFIMLTISIAVGILLATVLAFMVMLNPKAMKWYMKQMVKYVENMEKITEEEMAKDL